MSLLIDGYNLLHASGILPRGTGPATLERARNALINYLAAAIEPAELTETTIVFDAADAPPGLPDVYKHRGMTIRFARDHSSADELIEVLVRRDSAPRKLTVVSSDHRVQRAARRRRAKAVDSEQWHLELERQRRRVRPADEPIAKPAAPLSEAEVRHWLDEFGDIESQQSCKRPRSQADQDAANPFPPGYADDLLDDE